MKKLYIILFADDAEITKYSDYVCEKLSGLSDAQEFCGIWGEIQFNRDECNKAICTTVNYFINSDKEEIYFGCCEKDYNEIMAAINSENCEVVKLSRRMEII